MQHQRKHVNTNTNQRNSDSLSRKQSSGFKELDYDKQEVVHNQGGAVLCHFPYRRSALDDCLPRCRGLLQDESGFFLKVIHFDFRNIFESSQRLVILDEGIGSFEEQGPD